MAIQSMPNTKDFDENYDSVFGKKKECGCEDQVEHNIRVKYCTKNAGDDGNYLATCDEFPEMQLRAESPVKAFEKAEAWIAGLLQEVR